jgi:hypothetical protein
VLLQELGRRTSICGTVTYLSNASLRTFTLNANGFTITTGWMRIHGAGLLQAHYLQLLLGTSLFSCLSGVILWLHHGTHSYLSFLLCACVCCVMG